MLSYQASRPLFLLWPLDGVQGHVFRDLTAGAFKKDLHIVHNLNIIMNSNIFHFYL